MATVVLLVNVPASAGGAAVTPAATRSLRLYRAPATDAASAVAVSTVDTNGSATISLTDTADTGDYVYAVSGIDQAGLEGARSAAYAVSVPVPVVVVVPPVLLDAPTIVSATVSL